MNNTSLPLIASRMLNTPLLLDPQKAEVLLSVFGQRIGVDTVSVEELSDKPEMSSFLGQSRAGGAYRVADGAAIVPIRGTLVNRGAWIGSSSGLTSYEGIMQSLKWAVQDPEVERIVLDIDTPGGEASGIDQIASYIRAIRSQKPVIAVVNDLAASGGYAIAAQADKILVSKTGTVGSIGVILVHFDKSEAIAAAGIKPTIIHAGAHKADGNPFAPLPEGVRGVIQEGVDDIYGLFVDLVIAGRPSLSKQAVRDTEAMTYMGQAGIDAGLADGFGTIETAINVAFDNAVVESSSTTSKTKNGGETAKMSDKNEPAGAGAVSQEALGASVAQAREDGEVSAKARISAILESDEAKGREAQANHFAFKTNMSAEDAVAALAAAPKAETSTDVDQDKLVSAATLAGEGAAAYVGEDGGEPKPQKVKSMSEVYAKWN